jgi:hypothetical protein
LFNKKFICPILFLGLTVAGGASVAHAQVTDTVEATIPFHFQAGMAEFPAGTYTIRNVDTLTPSEMEIRSLDGSKSALFVVEEDEADKTPQASELIFNKVGDHYSLESIFDEGDSYGDMVVGYKNSKKLKNVAAAATPQLVHVPASHAGM